MQGAYVAIGQWVWGVGSTEEEAIKNCRAAGHTHKIALYWSATLTPNNVWLNKEGYICWNGREEDRPKYYAKIVGRRYDVVSLENLPPAHVA